MTFVYNHLQSLVTTGDVFTGSTEKNAYGQAQGGKIIIKSEMDPGRSIAILMHEAGHAYYDILNRVEDLAGVTYAIEDTVLDLVTTAQTEITGTAICCDIENRRTCQRDVSTWRYYLGECGFKNACEVFGERMISCDGCGND